MGKAAKAIDDMPVIDAKRAMKLIVTADDVKGADRKKPNACALAQACLHQPGVKEVRIHLSRAYVRHNDNNWQRFMVSPRLRAEIVAFDRGGRFQPGEYTLERGQPAKSLGKTRGGKDGKNTPWAIRKKRAKNRKPRPYHVMTDVRNGPA